MAQKRQLTDVSDNGRLTLNVSTQTPQLFSGQKNVRGVKLMVAAAARPSVTKIPHTLRPRKSAQREHGTIPRGSVARGASSGYGLF